MSDLPMVATMAATSSGDLPAGGKRVVWQGGKAGKRKIGKSGKKKARRPLLAPNPFET
jgi:hypothetical protein